MVTAAHVVDSLDLGLADLKHQRPVGPSRWLALRGLRAIALEHKLANTVAPLDM